MKFAWLVAGAAFCILLGLLIRLMPMEYIFTDSGVQLSSVDAYYYQVKANDLTVYDQSVKIIKDKDYDPNNSICPTIYQPVFSTILSTISQFTGIDTKTIAAVLPIIIFLFCIPVLGYISWLLFNNKMITALSVGLYAIMPGELLFRTMLGNGEQHCIEILLMLLCVMAILMIQKSKSIPEAITALILFVLFFFAYMQIWKGAIVIMVILTVYFLLYYFITEPNNILIRITIPIAVAMAAVVAVALKGELLFYMFGIDYLNFYNEGMPLFFTQGRFDLATSWNYFGITLYFAIIGLGMMIYVYWKGKQSKYLFFIVWTTILLIMTIASRRYDYYLAACVALLTAYVIYRVGSYLMTTQYRRIQVVFLGVILVALPLIRTGMVTANSDYGTMPVEWRETTEFLDETACEGTVLTHRDYGYWIMAECALTTITSPCGDINAEQLSALILLEENPMIFTQMLDTYTIRYIVIDESMFTDRLYPMAVMSGKIQAGDTLDIGMVNYSIMSKLYRGNKINGIEQIFESSNGKAKIYEYKKISNR